MIRRPPRSPLFPSTTLSRPRPGHSPPGRRTRAGTLQGPQCRALGVRPGVRADRAGFDPPSLEGQHTAAAWRSVASPNRLPSTCWISSGRSEEHTSELQSPCNLVCRLLLEKKKNMKHSNLSLQVGLFLLNVCAVVLMIFLARGLLAT